MRKNVSSKQSIALGFVAVGVLIVAFVSGAFYLGRSTVENSESEAIQSSSSTQTSGAIVTGDSSVSSTEKQLLYLLEEEKLAHDVYTKMYEKYGAKVFGNILNSESTHQASVLTLLNARDIADPRSDQVGVLTNQELQKLYDSLIAKGNKSAKDAYEVGVMIEEKDIKDITTQLETAKDSDVITTLEALRRGSENHLRAFNRQL